MKKEMTNPHKEQKQINLTQKKYTKKQNPSTKKEKKNGKEEYFTQNLIGVKEMYGGYFFLNNGQVIGIIEVYSINFDQKIPIEKQLIIDQFTQHFRIAPKNLHFKLKTEKANVDEIIHKIKQANANETDPKILEIMEDQITNIKNLQTNDTYRKKFYYIYEYEGDSEGRRSNNKKEIVQQMDEVKHTIMYQFKKMGNSVAIPLTRMEILTQPLEIAYRHFNPNTAKKESFNDRFYRLRHDEEKYNQTHKEKKSLRDCDYIAPKGLYLHPKAKDVLVMDGIYHTWLILNDNGYPEGEDVVARGWLANLLEGHDDIDIDVIKKTLPHDFTLELLKQSKKMSRSSLRDKRTNEDRQEVLSAKISHLTYMINRMKKDEDMHNAISVITIRANSLKDLYIKKRNIKKDLKKDSIYVSEAFGIRVPLFKMTMPFVYIDRQVFDKYCHNFLSSALASFYWYSAFEMVDPDGFVLGMNKNNNSLAVLNTFHKKYSNPHIVLLGTSGAGKTFTEQMLGYRMKLNGMKCIFVIPSKGMLDYKSGCDAINGSFIKLGPGLPTCINFLQIREDEINKTETISVRAKKIAEATTVVYLLMDGDVEKVEASLLNAVLVNLYEQFGITEDNNSIYEEDTGKIKKMPIPSDFYKETLKYPELSRISTVLSAFVNGSCKNMDGETNVDLTNDYIVFDVDEDTIDKMYFTFFLYVAFTCALSIAKRSSEELVALFLDEVWKLMKNKLSAEQVKAAVKLLRAYNSCVVLATQDIEDFLNTPDNFGKSVLTNTSTKILLGMVELEIKEVLECISLSPQEQKNIMNADKGDSLIIAGSNRAEVYLKASELEINTFKSKDNA